MKYFTIFFYFFCYFACAYYATKNDMFCIPWAISAICSYINYKHYYLKN